MKSIFSTALINAQEKVKIQGVETKDDVQLLFDDLQGKVELKIIVHLVKLSDDERAVPSLSWCRAETWVKWWNRLRQRQIVCVSYKTMNNDSWDLYQTVQMQ